MEESADVKIVFHKDTEILLMNGTLKKAMDIEEKDILVGAPYHNIVKKKYFSKENLYRIISRYGNSFVVGENTQFLIYDNKNCIFDHIDVKHYLTMDNENKNTISIHKTIVDYNEIELRIDPYILGLFIGNTNNFFIHVKNTKNIMKSIQRTIDILKLKKISTSNEHIIFISDVMLDDEIKTRYKFLFGSSKYIPEYCKKNSVNFRRKLLSGIIDINSVEKENYVEIRNLNKTLALGIYNLLFSIGIFHVLMIKENQYFNLKIFGDISSIQCEKNYEPKPFMYNNFKVASIAEKECVVIEVENGNSIVLSDFTII